MKKLFLTLIAAFAFCGSIFAQTTHWPEFYDPAFESQGGLSAFVQIDGTFIENTDDYANLEIAAFVGDECRGHEFMNDHSAEYGDPHPTIEISIFYNNPGETVTFKMWNHATNTEYTDCAINYLQSDLSTIVSYSIVTGEDYYDQWDYVDYGPVLSFTSPAAATFDLTINGYTASDPMWYLIATPFSGITPDQVTNMTAIDADDDYDLYSFNQSNQGQEWYNAKLATSSDPFIMEAGKGYLYARKTTQTLTFSGTAYSGTGIFDLDYDGSVALKGWNLVGNPYTVEAGVNKEFFIINPEGHADVIASTATTVQPGQGIFVYAEGAGESVQFTPGTSKSANLSLNVTQGHDVIDRAIVRFGEGRQLPKFQMNSESTKVYIEQGTKDYAVVSSEGQGEMPVSFKAKENGTYTLSFASEDVNLGYLHLIDNKTGEDINLLETPSYTFHASRTDYPSRFRLVFATGDNTESFGFVSNGEIVLNGVNANTTVQVIDAIGRILVSDNGLTSVSTNGMTPGVYVLRLINGDNATTQKIVVK